MYKVCIYRKEKLLPVFNNSGFNTIWEVEKNLRYWYQVKRNDQSAQFVVIDTVTDLIHSLYDKNKIEPTNDSNVQVLQDKGE